MQRTLRALAAGGLIAVLLVAPARSVQTFDGTYTGTVTRYPDQNLVSIVLSEVTVTVTGTAIAGVERFTWVRTPDYGEFVRVEVETTQVAEFSGPIAGGGAFRVPGVSRTSSRILSCEGNASNCNNVSPPAGSETAVEVAGTIVDGVLTAEIIWPGNSTGTYAVRATTTVSPTTTSVPGIIERDGILELTSPPGGILQLTRADLPAWARDLIVTTGAIHATAGPPGTIVGGDDRVLLDGLPIARVGDPTDQGGVIATGSEVILINGVPAAVYGSMVVTTLISGRIPAIGGPIVHPGCSGPAAGCNEPGVRSLETPTAAGDREIVVDDDTAWSIGDGVLIGDDPDTVEAAIVTGRGSLVLDRPLTLDHPAGTQVIRVPVGVVAEVVGSPTSIPLTSDPGPPIGFVVTLVGLGVAGWTFWRAWLARRG